MSRHSPLIQLRTWTLEAEVHTISRQLYANFVVKLDGKALGIVQLVGKRWTLGGRVAEQVGEDHQPLSDSEWCGHLRWYLGCDGAGTLV